MAIGHYRQEAKDLCCAVLYFLEYKYELGAVIGHRKGKVEYRVTEESLKDRLDTDMRSACWPVFCQRMQEDAQEFAKLIPNHKFFQGGRTNLYIKNLYQDIMDVVLKEKFSEYGSIDSTVVMKDKDGMSRGFGFVNFLSGDDAKNALENLNGSKLGNFSTLP
ncbi:hypothetical protein Cni_G06666 [Canna indica]|uniref:RRM domain-containing protein n=1 Tax=Canna indica TaxID=4628 RepID=A0AAQ3Q500_9LILI|nr:hypothetical protein Cni_G06666 [Canna indica]